MKEMVPGPIGEHCELRETTPSINPAIALIDAHMIVDSFMLHALHATIGPIRGATQEYEVGRYGNIETGKIVLGNHSADDEEIETKSRWMMMRRASCV